MGRPMSRYVQQGQACATKRWATRFPAMEATDTSTSMPVAAIIRMCPVCAPSPEIAIA